ncbi:MAG: CHASE2 domain-containing protein [Elainellaceae cyanobacterium]
MFRHFMPSHSKLKRSGSEPKSSAKPHRRNRYLPILECVSILIALGLWHWGKWQSLENLAYNALYQSRQAVLPSQGWDDRIAVIAIDDATLEQLNQFPLPRSYYADLLQTLNFSQPAVVGFDLLFSESSPDDEAFAGAIADSWNVVLAIADGLGDSSMTFVPELISSAAETGHAHTMSDSDGTIRKIDLYQENLLHKENPAERKFVPSLAIAILQIYVESLAATTGEAIPEVPDSSSFLESTAKLSAASPRDETLQPQPASADASADFTVWLNWPAPITTNEAGSCLSETQPGELQIYSLACMLDQQTVPDTFRNKIVLIGMTTRGFDPLVTPFNQNPPTSGVFVHAALIDNLLNDRLLQRPPRWTEGLLIALLGLGVAIAMGRLSLIGRGALLIGLPLLWFAASVGALQVNWWLPVAAPIGTVMLVFTGTQIREQLEKQQLMNLFEIYVSPETARHIWKHKQDVLTEHQSDVEKRVATILFVDIRRFTTISEQLPPDQLMTWLNRYLDTMTTCILDHGGRVDKYIGDEIMAVFSSPDEAPSDATDRHNAQCAIAASLSMNEKLRHLNHEFTTEGLPTVQFGIGIHTGTVVAGNMGGARRYNYSVVGDAVNVASRLQSLNKQITDQNPFHVLISSTTYDHVGDRYPSQPVGQLQLRGREQELLVYSLQELHEFKPL